MTPGGQHAHEREPHPLFGHDDEHDHGYEPAGPPRRRPSPGPSRAAVRQRRRTRRVFALVVLFLVVVVGVTAAVVWPHVSGWFGSDACGGKGSGTATVDVHPNDGAGTIADELCKQGVITAAQSFVDAAEGDSNSANIQPGSYTLPTHIAAKQALADLLDDKHRVRGLLVPEGATVVDVEKRLTAPRCVATSPRKQVCGLGASAADAQAALRNIGDLGLPGDYVSGGKAPRTPEGFLYPATYNFDKGTSAADALQQMVNTFIEEVRNLGFTDDAKALRLTPYQALTIASLVQSEAFSPQDMPKVARVILNRLAVKMRLKIDQATRYGALLDGRKPSSVDYPTFPTPYNLYLHDGLPPTPISNPGAHALSAAVHPAKGNWLYYVNGPNCRLRFTASDQVHAAWVTEYDKHRSDPSWNCA